MATKYWKYTIKGEHPASEAQQMLGEDASHGLIVRVDSGGGETHVYIAGPGPSAAKAKAAGGVTVQEVKEAEVTKIG